MELSFGLMLQLAQQASSVRRSVVVVDDHPCLRLGVKSALASSPFLRVVGEAADGAEALTLVREARPDLVVLDMFLPHVNGLEVMRQLLAEQPQLKVVAYSLRDEPWFMEEARAAGAVDYVCKSSDSSELVSAVQRAAVGEGLDRSRDFEATEKNERALSHAKVPRLSQREAEALRLLARGVAVKEAARQLNVGPRTVETYKVRGMQKLQLRSRADLIRFAEYSGWLQDGAEDRPAQSS